MPFQAFVGVMFGLFLVVRGIRIIQSPDEQAAALARYTRVFGITFPRRIRNASDESYKPIARLSGVVIGVVGVWVGVYMVAHP